MRWTQKEINEAIYMIKSGVNYVDIGLSLNRTANSVRNKLNEYGLNYKQFNQKEDKFCLNCSTKLENNKNTFCNHSCAATYNNKKRGTEIECLTCGEITKNYKFCSKKCSSDFQKNESFRRIDEGDVTLGVKRYKEYLIIKYGEKCMECGWCEVNKHSGKIPIELEHIDGNSDNNSLDNLKLLCPNCHSLTPTYGALNKGNGRTKRKEYRKKYREKLK
jgi:predicted nucleic acid-binding Zn ribbon protein